MVEVRQGAAERLARMIQLETVSAELERRGLEPFAAFRELIGELYPALTAALEFEQVGDLGLLYRWRGRPSVPVACPEPVEEPVEGPVVLMAHYDVVPVSDSGWTHPPFAGAIQNGRVYGRGALDDKGPLLVILEAVENLVVAGFTPDRDIYLALGGDEESFGTAASGMVDLLRARGIRPDFVLDEGGAIVEKPLPFIPGRSAMVGLGEKGAMVVRLTARSSGGHASAPPTLTATGRMARALKRVEHGAFPNRMPRAVRDMLRAFIPRASGASRLLLRVLTSLPWLGAQIFGRLGGEAAALVHTTVAATMISGGTANNVLAPEVTATLNLRVLPGETVESSLVRLRRAIRDPEIEVALVEGEDPSPESPSAGPGFEAIVHAVAEAYPDAPTVPYLMMQATDSRHWHRHVPNVYRFAPLVMDAAQRASIHGTDEQVDVSSLVAGEVFSRALIRRLAG
ncbi:MAG: M20/M25/M40 family metallo-hydrolase [Microbacterium sp.]